MKILQRAINENSSSDEIYAALHFLPPNALPENAQSWPNLRSAFRRFLRNAVVECEEITLPGSSRGIVTCGGGEKYLPSIYVMLRRLRELGCKLPMEVWHLGKEEMNPAVLPLLNDLGATTVDAYEVRTREPWRILKGWELKPYAVC